MKRSISEMVSPRLEAPERKVRHETEREQRLIDLRGFSHEWFPEDAGENLRQVAPVSNKKVLDDESPVIPDEEVTETVAIEERYEAGDQ